MIRRRFVLHVVPRREENRCDQASREPRTSRQQRHPPAPTSPLVHRTGRRSKNDPRHGTLPVWLDRLLQDQKLCRSRRAAYHDLWYENSVAVTWLFPAFHACDEDLGRGDAHGVCRLCHR